MDLFNIIKMYFIFQDDPEPSKCLGVFGLSLYTQERDLREVFSRYGTLDECNIVYDRQVNSSIWKLLRHFFNQKVSIFFLPLKENICC